MNRIPKVSILGTEYAVRWASRDEAAREYLAGAEIWGEARYKAKQILIDDSGAEAHTEKTFAHELCHAIMFEAGCRDDYTREELVWPMVGALLSVLKENDMARAMGWL